MRLALKKLSGFQERGEQLRKGRAAAPTLRSASPSATLVNVHLQFLQATTPAHATQSFVLYPAARAFFAYPCPYGDCDGIYDLTAAAGPTLTRDQPCMTGTLECSGMRSRDRLQRQVCGLRVSYTITAEHEPEHVPKVSQDRMSSGCG
jgi:hypothetical protein